MLLGTINSYTAGQGVTLTIDGEDAPTTKKYYMLKSYTPVVGDRVLIEEISDSYIVLGSATASGSGTSASVSWGNITGTLSSQTDLQNALNAKQATLTAGENISIVNNVISASGGSSGGGTWGSITGTLSDQTDLQAALDAKQNTLTAGNNITISSNNVIAATNEIMVVNINAFYAVDKSYIMIQNALNSGKSVYALDSENHTCIMSGVGSNYYDFSCMINAKQRVTYRVIDGAAYATKMTEKDCWSADKVIAATDWIVDTCTVTASSITETNIITVTYPPSTSAEDYAVIRNADIRVTAQAAGSITLQALGTIPSKALTITLVGQGV